MLLESYIERSTCRAVKALGYESIKLTGLKGLPDRLFISPNGFIFFVEFKSFIGKLSPHQIWWRTRLENHGCVYLVIRSKAELLEWIAKNI
jgi:hypothetical protein